MSNANPSRPGLDTATSKLEVAVPTGVEVGINKDRDVVRRTTLSNGNLIETQVFAGDHPDVEMFKTPAQIEAAEKKAEKAIADALAAEKKKAGKGKGE